MNDHNVHLILIAHDALFGRAPRKVERNTGPRADAALQPRVLESDDPRSYEQFGEEQQGYHGDRR